MKVSRYTITAKKSRNSGQGFYRVKSFIDSLTGWEFQSKYEIDEWWKKLKKKKGSFEIEREDFKREKKWTWLQEYFFFSCLKGGFIYKKSCNNIISILYLVLRNIL